MAFANWTNVPEMFVGKTVESVSGTSKNTMTLHFSDGSRVKLSAWTSDKELGNHTTQRIHELIVNPSSPAGWAAGAGGVDENATPKEATDNVQDHAQNPLSRDSESGT